MGWLVSWVASISVCRTRWTRSWAWALERFGGVLAGRAKSRVGRDKSSAR